MFGARTCYLFCLQEAERCFELLDLGNRSQQLLFLPGSLCFKCCTRLHIGVPLQCNSKPVTYTVRHWLNCLHTVRQVL